MELLLPMITLKGFLLLLAIITGVFVITTKNAIISVFNLIVLYILVAFYLIYIGIIYIGISYIIIYIGAIAILFLFIIMMIDVEVVEKRSNNYLPLLFLLLSGFLIALKKILYSIGLIKIKMLSIEEKIYEKSILFNPIELSGFMVEKEEEIIEHKSANELCNDIDISYKEDIFNTLYIDWNEKSGSNKSYSDSFLLSLYDSSNPLASTCELNSNNNYLLIVPDWDSATNRVTQISAIGDVLYTVYHSYIYILSVILLLGMVGAIILTADTYQVVKVIGITNNKKSSLFINCNFIKLWYSIVIFIKSLLCKLYNLNTFLDYLNYIISINKQKERKEIYLYSNFKDKYLIKQKNKLFKINKYSNELKYNSILGYTIVIPSFYDKLNMDDLYLEGVMGNLTYFILANIIIAILLLGVNSYFSLSVKYLEKGGGFECGFTSFVQTRERFNVIFYRVSLLFLVFDLEIILAFPYTVVYQKNQNISKNNVIAFLYILIVGFIYELKEGALNIVNKVHSTDISITKK